MEAFLIRLATFSFQRVLALSLLAGGVYYFFAFNDGSGIKDRTAKKRADLVTQREIEKDSMVAIKQEEEIKKELAELNDQFKLATERLPKRVESAEVSRDVDEAASISGLSIKTKTPGTLRDSSLSVVREQPIEITGEGSFSEITLFLFHLGSMKRIMRVSDFTMASINPQDPALLRFKGEIVSYLFKEPNEGKSSQ